MDTDPLRSLKIGDDYVAPAPDLRPWFIVSSTDLQSLLKLDSPPNLHQGLIIAHCLTIIDSSLTIVCGAPPVIKSAGTIYFPTSAAEVSVLENSAERFFRVQDVRLEICRREGWEEIGGRAVVFVGGHRHLETTTTVETRRGRALLNAEAIEIIETWANGVEEGDWEEMEVVWEQVDSHVTV